MNDRKNDLTEENWEEITEFADDLLDSFDGRPTYVVIHALELVYAYLRVNTDIHLHSMMNNIMAIYKNFKKDLEDYEDEDRS